MEKKRSIIIWLTAAGLCIGLLPDFVRTIWAAGMDKPLPAGYSFGIGLAAAALGLLCFMRSVYIRLGKEPAGERKTDWLSYLVGAFPCLLVILIVVYGGNAAVPVLAAAYALGKGLFFGIMAGLVLTLSLVLGILFFGWMNACRKEPLKHPVHRFFSRIYLGIPMALLLWAALLTIPLGQVVIGKFWEEPGVFIRHLTLMTGSLLLAFLVYGALLLAEKMMAGAQVFSETDGCLSGKRHIPSLVCLILCFFLTLFQNLPQLTGDEAAMLNAWLKDSLVEYGFYLAAADTGNAAWVAEEAARQMDMALSEAEEEEEEAEKKEEEEPSAARKAREKTKAIRKVCDKYEIFRTDGRALMFLEQFKKYGGADQELAENALSLSEEYPEHLRVQYAAAVIGSSLTYDKAKHYDRTAEAILRYEELYRNEKEPTDPEKAEFEKTIARMLLKIYHEEEAARLLEEMMPVDSGGDAELYELLAQCYDRTDRQEEAYELAASYCEKRDDSPYLMYYGALSALKLEKIEESLAYTSKLASYTAECEGEELNQCDSWLFEMLEFLTLSDSRSYTDFQYDVYRELTEEENAVIDANPFFRNYLDAVYLAYRSDHKKEPEEAFDKIEAVLRENPGLASAWYLCGVISSNSGETEYREGAVRFYQKAGELNDGIPAVWYAMAREYDRLGEYEKGIEACKKALSLLPEQDHGNDWYGINYHCSRLMSSMQAAVKR